MKVALLYDGAFDDSGRCHFTAFWPSDGPGAPRGFRAQCFFANPNEVFKESQKQIVTNDAEALEYIEVTP